MSTPHHSIAHAPQPYTTCAGVVALIALCALAAAASTYRPAAAAAPSPQAPRLAGYPWSHREAQRPAGGPQRPASFIDGLSQALVPDHFDRSSGQGDLRQRSA
jgi:hypothetical protein